MRHFNRSDLLNQMITFSFGSREAKICTSPQEGEMLVEIDLPYTAVFGMGEKFNAVNQKGNHVLNQVIEKFCYQQENAYCPMPFFFTENGFGLCVNSKKAVIFKFFDHIQITMPQEAELILFSGSPQEIISQFITLFGTPKLPPKWAFGPWISANRWSKQSQLEEQMKFIETYDFPVTVMVMEAWSDEATFYVFHGAEYSPVQGKSGLHYEDFDFSKSPYWSDPKGTIKNLHDKNIHLVLWQIPVYKKMENHAKMCKQHEIDQKEAVENRLCVCTKSGEPYLIPEGNWFEGSMIPDFTNPETVKTWFAKRQYLLDIGVDGFKTDGGEFIYREDLCFHDASDGSQMKNAYAQAYVSAYTRFIGEDRVLFSRAGYLGQHTTPILWAGDQQSASAELVSVLKAGLSAASSGIIFWSFDIAGFAGELPTIDLYLRSTQMACFVPVMQWHSEPDGGQFQEMLDSDSEGGIKTATGNNERSPWNLAFHYDKPDLIPKIRYWHNLRMNLLPYLYALAKFCVKEKKPMMRPLVFHYPDDRNVFAIEDEFLLGEGLLIAPVLEENALRRNVYLPKGHWYHIFTGKWQEGEQEVEVACEDKIPVYLKEGNGIALNLGVEGILGSSVGNRVDCYGRLQIWLAGGEGSYAFVDDLGNDFVLSWRDGVVEQKGEVAESFEIIMI